jgi:hypothetical protein
MPIDASVSPNATSITLATAQASYGIIVLTTSPAVNSVGRFTTVRISADAPHRAARRCPTVLPSKDCGWLMSRNQATSQHIVPPSASAPRRGARSACAAIIRRC